MRKAIRRLKLAWRVLWHGAPWIDASKGGSVSGCTFYAAGGDGDLLQWGPSR